MCNNACSPDSLVVEPLSPEVTFDGTQLTCNFASVPSVPLVEIYQHSYLSLSMFPGMFYSELIGKVHLINPTILVTTEDFTDILYVIGSGPQRVEAQTPVVPFTVDAGVATAQISGKPEFQIVYAIVDAQNGIIPSWASIDQTTR